MSWTYSGDPSKSAKDAVRFYIGDTDSQDPLLLDAEINFLLSQYNNAPLNAAIKACDMIVSKFSRLADESVGSVRIAYSQKAKAYRSMKEDFRSRLATEDCMPFAGGISKQDKEMTRLDPDRVKPDFSKHMQENERIVSQTSTEGALLERGLANEED